jgi:ACS family glucarate transporter-like MFS transporter
MSTSSPTPNPIPSAAVLPPPAQSPSHVRYVVMTFLCVLAFITYFDRVGIAQAQDLIMHDLGLSKVQWGWVLGLFWAAYAIFEIPSGWLGDRYGARGTLTRVVLAWSLFTALTGSAMGFISLILFRFIFGAGEAGAFPNMARIQSAWLPPSARSTAGGLLWLFARWGGAFSPALVVGLLAVFSTDWWHHLIAGTWLVRVAPWRLMFITSGLTGLVWIAVFFFWFRDNPAHKKSVNQAELNLIREGRSDAELAAHHHTFPGMWKALFSSKTLWLIACVYICGSFGWSFFVSWIPSYFKEKHKLDMKASFIMTGLPMFCGGISCLLGGMLSNYLVNRTGRKRLFRAVFPIAGDMTAGICMFCIPFCKTPTQATVLLCLASAGHDFGQPINWATIVDVGGRFAGTAFGFINMVGNIGNTIQPPIGGWIQVHFGWNTLFFTYAFVFATGASLWFFIDPRRRFYREDDPPIQRGFEVVVDR